MARRVLFAALITSLGAVSLAACAGGSPTTVGGLVASWSQADAEWVTDMPPRALMTTDTERDDWLRGIPENAPGIEGVLSVDLTTHVLFAGSYPRCTEYSVIYAEETDQGYGLRFAVETDEPDRLCAWSPVALDVWAVPHSDTGGAAPTLVDLST